MKHVQVRLENEDYKRLQKEMDDRGIEFVQDAVLTAIRSWAGSETVPFGKLARSEERYLMAVLRYVRQDKGVLMPVLDELVRINERSG